MALVRPGIVGGVAVAAVAVFLVAGAAFAANAVLAPSSPDPAPAATALVRDDRPWSPTATAEPRRRPSRERRRRAGETTT